MVSFFKAVSKVTLVDWKDDFRTGVDEVDFEHRELVELINESYAEARRSGSSDDLMDFLGEIYEKISAHFALEEKVMLVRHYSAYTEHKEDHEALLDSILDIMDSFVEVEDFDEVQFGESLKNWFVRHFSTHDAQLHKMIPH